MGRDIGWGTTYIEAAQSFRAPIFYDSNDTSYYTDPNGTSNFAGYVYSGNSYTYGWFRNEGQQGLYNASYGNHFYSTSDQYWNIAGNNGSACGLIMRTGGHQGSVRGYVYADNGNNIGFISQDGNWQIRCNNSEVELYDVTYTNDLRSYIMYDRNDTGFYCDPNGTSRLNGLTVGYGQGSSVINMYDSDEGTRYLHNNSGTIGFLNSGGAWRFRVFDDGNVIMGTYQDYLSTQIRSNIFYKHDDTGYYLNPNTTSRLIAVNVNDAYTYGYYRANYVGRGGICGIYDSTKYQNVFTMGDSWNLASDGSSVGNLYGMSWSHPNAGGVAGNLDSHGMIVHINGGFASCMSYSIKASSNVTAYSDERLKKDWVDLPKNYVEQLAKVKVGTYTRIDGEKLRQVGVSAQSLRPLLPEAVIEAEDDFKTLSVAYGNAAMASAVELAKEVVSLKQQLAAVLERLNKLENK
jgi:hypothetical protein